MNIETYTPEFYTKTIIEQIYDKAELTPIEKKEDIEKIKSYNIIAGEFIHELDKIVSLYNPTYNTHITNNDLIDILLEHNF